MSSEEQLHCDMERFRKALRLIAMMAPAQVEGCEGAILATRQLEIAEDLDDTGKESSSVARLRRSGVTTLQVYGLPPWATVEGLVTALNAVGYHRCYNFIHRPRHMDGVALGYCFINFTTVENAERFAQSMEQQPLQLHSAWGNLTEHFMEVRPAKKQGYHNYVNEKAMEKFNRIRNARLWPLVTSLDGSKILMATPEAAKAAAWQVKR
mmetsp:Transcript_3165/g.7969  ORF Transcript_3165/g.7969 Transcript_3165/m.7969 type:complete len:209 (-) Transcript_3165:112-738(-)